GAVSKILHEFFMERGKFMKMLGVFSSTSHACASPISLRDNRHVARAITKNPEIMHGTPVFRGTRVPVQTLFDYLEGGETLEDFLEGFPKISRELAVRALEEAKQLLLARCS